MHQKPTLKNAISLARRAHAGQKDKAGIDYITHPLRVMETVEGEDAKIVAVLHDVLEDTEVTEDDLRSAGYSPAIITAILGVTKRPDEEKSDEGYMRFVQRAAQNPLSKAVKIADLKDNLDRSRISKPTVKDEERTERYQRALQFLQS